MVEPGTISLLTLDLHPSNFVIGFKPINTTVDQLIKKSVADHDPEKYYKERIVDSRWERFYGHQPLCLPDGAPFTLKNMVVKICDFGHGLPFFEVS
jgi:hypothetical protein